MSNGTLLLVDDDRQVLASMADWLRSQGYELDTAQNCQQARAAISSREYNVALVDVRLPDGDGFELLADFRKRHPSTSVILITGYGTADSAIDAIRIGAFDYLTKPLIDDELEMAIQRALTQRKVLEENENLKAQLDIRFGMENIIGNDHRMRRVFDVVDSIANTRATVLIHRRKRHRQVHYRASDPSPKHSP